ncbi:MAG: hypothetical protein CM1200mP9_06680 [Gammaproteobacteria bacterium]|nr:MAG: hypothetical protein CM1200mP9_06680 [Gammaproteobacteria bacterium]
MSVYKRCRGHQGLYARDLFPEQIEWKDGYAWCGDTPGLGVELNEDLAHANKAPLKVGHPYLADLTAL